MSIPSHAQLRDLVEPASNPLPASAIIIYISRALPTTVCETEFCQGGLRLLGSKPREQRDATYPPHGTASNLIMFPWPYINQDRRRDRTPYAVIQLPLAWRVSAIFLPLLRPKTICQVRQKNETESTSKTQTTEEHRPRSILAAYSSRVIMTCITSRSKQKCLLSLVA